MKEMIKSIIVFYKILFYALTPIIITMSPAGDPEKEHIENMTIKGNKDFQQWEVAENRNKKINKILRQLSL